MSSRSLVGVALLCALCASCGDEATTDVAPIAEPTRTAARADDLRRMFTDIAIANTCDALINRFVPIPDPAHTDRARVPTTVGRFRVEECSARDESGRFVLSLSGRGWQWVSRSGAGPIGSEFIVRATVRFAAEVRLDAELDLAYATDAHRASFIVTPVEPVQAQVHAIGAVPIESAGGWSDLVGTLGRWVGADPSEEARAAFAREGAEQFATTLREGVTLTMDLCELQPDLSFGALGDDEVPPRRPLGEPWLENAWVRVEHGSFDIAGPFAIDDRGELFVDVAIDEGGPVNVQMICNLPLRAQLGQFFATGATEPIAGSSIIAERDAPENESTTFSSGPLERTAACSSVFVVYRPTSTSPGTTLFRTRIYDDAEPPLEPVDCD